MGGPRGPSGGPSRPPPFRPSDGGFDGRGGSMPFVDTDPFRHPNMPYGSGGSASAYRDGRPSDTLPSYGSSGAAAQTRFSPPPRRPSYDATAELRQQQNMMQASNPVYAAGLGVSQAAHDSNLYSSSSGMPYTSAATGGPSTTLRSAMKRNVGFEDAPTTETAHLTRPREEEIARGETNAGAVPDKRDGLGTL